METIVWYGPEYIGVNSRRKGAQPPYTCPTAVSTPVFSGARIPDGARNIRARFSSAQVVDGKAGTPVYMTANGQVTAWTRTGPQDNMPCNTPGPGASSLSLHLEHTCTPAVKGSTWEFHAPNRIIIEYDPGALEWVDGLVFDVTPTESFAQGTLSWVNHLGQTLKYGAPGLSKFRLEQSDDSGNTWTLLDEFDAYVNGILQISRTVDAPPVQTVRENGGSVVVTRIHRMYRLKAISSLGASCDSPWVTCRNTLTRLYDPSQPAKDGAFGDNPAVGNTVLSWTSDPARNNAPHHYEIAYRDYDRTDSAGEWITLSAECLTPYIEVTAPIIFWKREFRIRVHGTVYEGVPVARTTSDWYVVQTKLERKITCPSKPGKPSFYCNPALNAQPMSWTASRPGANNPVHHYEIGFSRDGETWELYATAASTSVQIGEPLVHETYFFRVRAMGTVEGYDSEWSEASDGLLNVKSLFPEDGSEDGASLLWKLDQNVDLAFARRKMRQVGILASEGDKFSHAFMIRVKHNGKPFAFDGYRVEGRFRNTLTEEEYHSEGYVSGYEARIVFAAQVEDKAGEYVGTAYMVNPVSGAYVALDHIAFRVEAV